MKKLISNSGYVFNASAKTVTFSDYTTIELEGVLLITNLADNLIVYNFANPLLGGTVSGNILTLTYNTSSMDNADKLQIFYDDVDVQPATTELQTTLYSLTETLQELTSRLNVIASMSNAGAPALRVIPIASVSTAVTGTVTATVASTEITNVTNLGGVPAYITSVASTNLLPELGNISNVTT